MILSMMVNRDEDTKSESSSNILKETTLAILYIFHSIKQSEDVVDAAKSKVCDVLSVLVVYL